MASGQQAIPVPSAASETAPAPLLQEKWWRPVYTTFIALGIPCALVMLPALMDHPLPVYLLYAIAGTAGIVIAARAMRDPEWLIAAFILYIPFTRMYVAPIAPGINATNMLEGLLILAWGVRCAREGRPFFARMPFTRLMAAWAVLSLLSLPTAAVTMGSYFIGEQAERIKGWLDQFIIFFAFLNLIRNGAMARRVAIYMAVGTLIVILFGFSEWQDKRNYASIEAARLLGPQLQPNDLGAFLVYGAALPMAWLVLNPWRLMTWVVAAPTAYMLFRVLFGTFSRGGFVALVFMVAAAMLVRGRTWLAIAIMGGIGVVQLAPELLPSSVLDRMSQTTDENTGQLDTSAQTRIILWAAAERIILENPVLGTGFNTFPHLKGRYTEVEVHESDNHNMFLYIGSQMGLPALATFILIFLACFVRGARLALRGQERTAQAVGLGGCAIAAAVFSVNMFGSRMVDVVVMGYVWITVVVLSHVLVEQGLAGRKALPARR
jgi:putative inorganic carbon (HCO3(-)) transporter